MTKIPAGDRLLLVERVRGGETFESVARHYGCSRQRVQQLWKRYGYGERVSHYPVASLELVLKCRCGEHYVAGTYPVHVKTSSHTDGMRVRWGREFWARVQPDSGGCWIWMGARTPAGYGSVGTGKRSGVSIVYAHRFAYELVKGQIPDGLVIDHLCRVPPCVNPEHLEAVTHRENVRRGKNGVLRHLHAPRASRANPDGCLRGHPYTTTASGRRYCRTCGEASRRRMVARRASEEAVA